MKSEKNLLVSARNNILIVDDDLDDRNLIQEALNTQFSPKQYFHFDNGEKLLEYLNKLSAHQYPAFIILDLNMPVKGGEQTLREIKNHPELRVVPVVIITGSFRTKYRELYKLGANCVLQKPSDYFNLTEMINALSFIYFLQGGSES